MLAAFGPTLGPVRSGVRRATILGDVLPRRPSAALRRLLAIPFWPIRRLLWPQFAWVRATVVESDHNAAIRAGTLERRLAATEDAVSRRLTALEGSLEAIQDRLSELETAVVESMALAGGEMRATGDAIAALAQTQAAGGAPAVAAYAGRAFGGLDPGDRIVMGGGVSDDVADALEAVGLRPVDGAADECAGAIVAVSGLGSGNGADAGALEGLQRIGEAVRDGGTMVVVAADTTPAAAARALASWEVSDLGAAPGDQASVLATVRVVGEVARA